MLAEGCLERRVPQDGHYLIGHLIYVPEIDGEHVSEHFADAGLPGNNDRHVVAHGLERGDAKGLRDRRHNVEVSHAIDFLYVRAAEKSGEEHLVAYSHLSGHLNGSPGHISGTGHYKFHISHDPEHFFGRCQEVLRPLLNRDPAEEEELLNDDMGDDTPDEKPAVVTSVTGPPSNVPDTLEPDEEEEGDLMAILDQHGELKVREAFDRMGYQDSGDTPRRVKGLLEQLVQRGFVNYRWKDAAGRYSLTLAGEAHLASLRS